MNKVMNALILSCKKASELIDKKSIVRLSFKENIQLHMHTALCDGCKTYQKQSKVLDHFLEKKIKQKDETKVPQITNDKLKQQIISKL
jgi:hypothetical protein